MSKQPAKRIALVIVLVVAGGCAPSISYHGGPTVLRSSPVSGRCDLYSEGRLVDSSTVVTGEKIGFKREGREVVAVAGPHEFRLPNGNYSWIIIQAHGPGWDPPWPAVSGWKSIYP